MPLLAGRVDAKVVRRADHQRVGAGVGRLKRRFPSRGRPRQHQANQDWRAAGRRPHGSLDDPAALSGAEPGTLADTAQHE